MIAHISDWHSGNPKLHPLGWLLAIICAVVIYYFAMAAMGSYLNGA